MRTKSSVKHWSGARRIGRSKTLRESFEFKAGEGAGVPNDGKTKEQALTDGPPRYFETILTRKLIAIGPGFAPRSADQSALYRSWRVFRSNPQACSSGGAAL